MDTVAYSYIVMLCIIAVLVLFLILWHFHHRKTLRKHLFNTKPSVEQIRILFKMPLYRRLPIKLKHQLRGHMAIIRAEKNFEGCHNLRVTEEMKTVICALAGMLLLNKKLDYYPELKTILIYPGAYHAKAMHPVQGNVAIVNENDGRLGESWLHGDLVLAYDHVRLDAFEPQRKGNVVLHEFAHQIDQLNGYADGLPPLDNSGEYAQWKKTLNETYNQLCSEKEHAVKEVIDWYGATNAAEFFAVTTESFFCSPIQLQKAHPQLYNNFVTFYKVDPAQWRQK